MALLETIDEIDRSLFLWLNGHHHAALDSLMWYVSKMYTWIPVYVFMFYRIYKKFGMRGVVYSVVFVSLILFITDFVAVKLIKNTVMRLRPGYEPLLDGKVHFVIDPNGNYYKGGRFGFFSNHASNYSGIITFFLMLMRPTSAKMILAFVSWGILIVYSRIYLGVHYPGDILAGVCYGMCAGFLFAQIFLRFNPKLKSQ